MTKTTAMAAEIHRGDNTHHQLQPMTWVSLRTTKTSVSKVTMEMLDVLEFFMALFDLQ